jgi:hypothetical protein
VAHGWWLNWVDSLGARKYKRFKKQQKQRSVGALQETLYLHLVNGEIVNIRIELTVDGYRKIT